MRFLPAWTSQHRPVYPGECLGAWKHGMLRKIRPAENAGSRSDEIDNVMSASTDTPALCRNTAGPAWNARTARPRHAFHARERSDN